MEPSEVPAVRATYRLQLRGDGLRFDDAAALVDYLDELGVSHLYLSPVLTATAGSTHGYDVTDPTTVSDALGGHAGLQALAARARSRGMGLVIDIVPNHVGVADPRQNRWWWDLLQHGQESRYARHFDIDIDIDSDSSVAGKIALPALGDGDGPDDLTVDRTGPEPMLAYYDKRFPIAPGTDTGSAAEIHARQTYRLVPWNAGLVGYRRFFTIDDLAAVRVEDPAVFDDAHAKVAEWVADGLVDGIRVDHPDGLADPPGYLARLRTLLGPDRWLVIEKILGADEPLDPTLPVDGTTGYDALNELAAVFVDPRGESTLTDLSRTCTGSVEDAAWFHEQEVQSKRSVLTEALAPEVRRLVRAVRRDAGGVDAAALRDAVIAVAATLPVYRADYAPLAGLLPRVVGEVAGARPDLEPALQLLVRALAAGGEAAARFGQVCGAATAKAVEDRLFYRASRLVSLQEVGGQPGRFAMPVSQFHLAWQERARRWPRTMTTLSTHDTKRSEDVRARISVLSQVAARWAAHLAEWDGLAPSPDPTFGSFLWQTLFGVWPEDGTVTAELRGRVHEYTRKALRENGTRTTWTQVDEGFEAAVAAWIDSVIDGPVHAAMTAFVGSVAPHVAAVSLGQKLLHLLGPGIPDVYQGTELWDDSLVDPDNRRPVDFDARRRLLADPEAPPKFRVVREALQLRRTRSSSFVDGAYVPLLASGPAAGHVLAFGRGPAAGDLEVVTVATLHTAALDEIGWEGTVLNLPVGVWTDRLTGRTLAGTAPMSEIAATLPVAMLERTGGGACSSPVSADESISAPPGPGDW